MPALTPEQISALTSNGARRWQKSGMDRVYLSVYRLGLRIDKRSGQAWLADDPIPAEFLPAIQGARVWIDAKTGNLFTKMGSAPSPLPADAKRYYQTSLRENAKAFIDQSAKQSEWQTTERKTMDIKSAALKWRKGNIVSIDGRQLAIGEISIEDTPFGGGARMICDARLVVRQFDGKFRRIDLNEIK
jgi:hypothetical protein